MKKDFHPIYNDGVLVTCACGDTFKTRSTQSEMTLEI